MFSLQVWWTLGGDNSGGVSVYNVLDGTTLELPRCGMTAAVLSMGVDGSGRVWLGIQGGLLQVWCPVYLTLIAQQSCMMLADVRSYSTLLLGPP